MSIKRELHGCLFLIDKADDKFFGKKWETKKRNKKPKHSTCLQILRGKVGRHDG
jgi:hypothetical protein